MRFLGIMVLVVVLASCAALGLRGSGKRQEQINPSNDLRMRRVLWRWLTAPTTEPATSRQAPKLQTLTRFERIEPMAAFPESVAGFKLGATEDEAERA